MNNIKPLHLAIAQSLDAEGDAKTLDTLTVTGSRISIPGVEASSPVSSVECQEFLSTQPVAVKGNWSLVTIF